MRHTLYTSCPGGQYQKDTVCQVEAFLVYTQTILRQLSDNPQTILKQNIQMYPPPIKIYKRKIKIPWP